MKKKENTYQLKKWCGLIAHLINCDNLRFGFTKETYSADKCWNYNANGELFGLFDAINFVNQFLENKIFKKEITSDWNNILKGDTIEPTKEKSTGLGIVCVTMMWQCSDKFTAFAEQIIQTHLELINKK